MAGTMKSTTGRRLQPNKEETPKMFFPHRQTGEGADCPEAWLAIFFFRTFCYRSWTLLLPAARLHLLSLHYHFDGNVHDFVADADDFLPNKSQICWFDPSFHQMAHPLQTWKYQNFWLRTHILIFHDKIAVFYCFATKIPQRTKNAEKQPLFVYRTCLPGIACSWQTRALEPDCTPGAWRNFSGAWIGSIGG